MLRSVDPLSVKLRSSSSILKRLALSGVLYALTFGALRAEAAPAFWKDCQQVISRTWLGFLFPGPRSTSLERLKLPREVFVEPMRYSPRRAAGARAAALKFLSEEGLGTTNWNDLQRLADKVTNEAQYMVFRVLVWRDEPLSSPLARRLHEFVIMEQAGPVQLLRNTIGKITDRDIDDYLLIQNRPQLEFFMISVFRYRTRVNVDFVKSKILPRLSTQLQGLALEHVIEYGRGNSDGLLRLALNVTNPHQIEFMEFLLDQSAVDSVFETVLAVRSAADLPIAREKFLKNPMRIPEPEPPAYRNSDAPLVFLQQFGVTRQLSDGLWHSMYRSLKLPPEDRLKWFYRASGDPLDGGPEARRRLMRSNKAEARKKANFYRNIYLKLNEGKYNGVSREKFNDDWLNVLWDEDRHLPQERLAFFEFTDQQDQTLAFFSVFDGSAYPGEVNVLIPALQKRPHVADELMKRITEHRGGRAPKHVFEWRRLAIRRGDSAEPQDKIRLPEVEQTLIAYLKRFGFVDAVVIGHTDSFGLKTFSEKTRLKPIMSAQELAGPDGVVPDEHILWMDIAEIP